MAATPSASPFAYLPNAVTTEARPGREGGLFVAQVSPIGRLRQTLLTVPRGATTVADAIAARDAFDELIALEAARYRTARDMRDLNGCLDEMRDAGDDLEMLLHANCSLHERIAAIARNELARAIYVGMLRCITELSVRADRETASTPVDYRAQRLAVHEELVATIQLGDEERVKAAIAAHRADSASGIPEGCSWRLPAPAVDDRARESEPAR